MRRDDPDETHAWVRECILAALGASVEPLTRDRLTERVLDSSFERHGLRWKRTTAARRVRDALAELLDSDHPVISAGHGYMLATRATQADRERAAVLAERQAVRLLTKARRIRAVTLPGDSVLADLFSPGHPAIAWRP
jgi:hypothetical protein